MKVKMLEYFQGSEHPEVLEPEKVYDLDDTLAKWLLENKKAEAVKEVKAKAEEPEPQAEAAPPVTHSAGVGRKTRRKGAKR